jgi:hypothetical protein
MNSDDLKGLKYYIIYAIVLIGFFVYSGITGWKWFNPTKTEPTRTTNRIPYINRAYHK